MSFFYIPQYFFFFFFQLSCRPFLLLIFLQMKWKGRSSIAIKSLLKQNKNKSNNNKKTKRIRTQPRIHSDTVVCWGGSVLEHFLSICSGPWEVGLQPKTQPTGGCPERGRAVCGANGGDLANSGEPGVSLSVGPAGLWARLMLWFYITCSSLLGTWQAWAQPAISDPGVIYGVGTLSMKWLGSF